MATAANMTKTLTERQGTLVFVVDETIREQWNIDAKTPLKVTVDGDKLILEARRDSIGQREFDAAVDKIVKRYEPTFRKLAE